MDAFILDQTDLEILRLLQQNAWLTSKEIAFVLKKGNSTIIRRIESLKNLGFIKGSAAVLDHYKIGEVLVAFTQIQLINHSTAALDEFQLAMLDYEEVRECYHMTGNVDFLLKVVLPDIQSYNRFLKMAIADRKYVGSVQSTFVLNETKRDLGYPIRGKF